MGLDDLLTGDPFGPDCVGEVGRAHAPELSGGDAHWPHLALSVTDAGVGPANGMTAKETPRAQGVLDWVIARNAMAASTGPPQVGSSSRPSAQKSLETAA